MQLVIPSCQILCRPGSEGALNRCGSILCFFFQQLPYNRRRGIVGIEYHGKFERVGLMSRCRENREAQRMPYRRAA